MQLFDYTLDPVVLPTWLIGVNTIVNLVLSFVVIGVSLSLLWYTLKKFPVVVFPPFIHIELVTFLIFLALSFILQALVLWYPVILINVSFKIAAIIIGSTTIYGIQRGLFNARSD